ncbi:MAG: polysaccharide deacetylase family protein [Planctomycetes bacterium]|nr:polysaccharide deacetylase family protein [Planctomycetota bacterium]
MQFFKAKPLALLVAILFGTALQLCAADIAKTGDSAVLPVKDGKKAAFLVQFDDAHASQIPVVVPALKERGMVGTFYIFNRKELTDKKDEWIKAAKEGVVHFGNHTYTHKYTQNSFPDVETCDEEISKCNELIKSLTPDAQWPRIMPYARPGGKTPADRGIGEKGMEPVLDKHHFFVRPNFWGASIHVKTVDDMKRIVDRAVKNGGMGHLDFHGVGKKSSINVTCPHPRVHPLCDYFPLLASL